MVTQKVGTVFLIVEMFKTPDSVCLIFVNYDV